MENQSVTASPVVQPQYDIPPIKPKLKVFNMPWHIGHQYELVKLPFEWNYLMQHTRKWSHASRPMPKQIKWVPYYEEGKYDFALLHIDQQCLLSKNGVAELGKGKLFDEVKKVIGNDIPIIVINHGTPIYPERFILQAGQEGYRETDEGAIQWAIDRVKEKMEGVVEMVVNSHEAQKMWGFGKAIIHGMDPDEWWDLPKEPRIVTSISPAGMGDKYYGRRLFRETKSILKEEYGITLFWIGEVDFAPSWDAYRRYLGKSLVYFNPTYGSPMPRARTEAMLSGSCVVTTRHHDADTFINHGKNGFIVRDNPKDAAKLLAELVFDYKTAIKIGQEGKKTAKEIFSKERFQQDWFNLVGKVLNKKI